MFRLQSDFEQELNKYTKIKVKRLRLLYISVCLILAALNLVSCIPIRPTFNYNARPMRAEAEEEESDTDPTWHRVSGMYINQSDRYPDKMPKHITHGAGRAYYMGQPHTSKYWWLFPWRKRGQIVSN